MLRRRLNLFTIAFAIFSFLYTLIITLGFIQASKLVPVEGELISAHASYRKPLNWNTYSPPHWELAVEYTYRFRDVSYQGTRWRISGNGSTFESVAENKAKEMMAADKRIIVWVNQNNPEFAVIDRGIGILAWLFWFILILFTWLTYHFSGRNKSANPDVWKSRPSGRIDRSSDVLKEADTYIAYGRTAQAIAILENALSKYPHRQDIAQKLSKLRDQI